MTFIPTGLEGSYIIQTSPFTDERGRFARYFCKKEFQAIGHKKEWVQLNHSVTEKKGTLRGMHYQVPPYGEIKMVKCIRGNVFDVIIDLRENSSTFLKWFGIEISAKNQQLLYIPEGFAHGFQCLEDNCELIYHHSEYYQSGAERGINYNDPLIRIDWPLEVSVISQRDAEHDYLPQSFKGIQL